jgi:hypothetical protein
MRKEASRKGERPIEFGTDRVAVLSRVGRFIGSFFLFSRWLIVGLFYSDTMGSFREQTPRARCRFYISTMTIAPTSRQSVKIKGSVLIWVIIYLTHNGH